MKSIAKIFGAILVVSCFSLFLLTSRAEAQGDPIQIDYWTEGDEECCGGIWACA